MAGYSHTPLPKKLGIKERSKVALIDPPRGFQKVLGSLPQAAAIQVGLMGKDRFDVIFAFVTTRAALQRQVTAARRHMTPAAGLWIA